VSLEVREITAAGSGAVSIVLVRGEGALARVRAVFDRDDCAIGVPRLVRLKHAGADLDEALVCALSQNEVEIHLHGSPVLVHAVLVALETPERDGPLTIEERALAQLPWAASESGARILLDQAQGAWRRFVDDLARTHEPRRLVTEVESGSRVAAFTFRAPVVVLAGAVNAGKSTLFNVLVGSERTITSPEPGTTRDVVRSRGRLGRYVVEFVDTAGERDIDVSHGQAEIERAGIAHAVASRAQADLVLWLALDERSPAPLGAITLYAQSDRRSRALEPALSALRDPSGARDIVQAHVQSALSLPDDPWVPGAARAFDDDSRAQLKALAACRTDAEVRAEIARAHSTN